MKTKFINFFRGFAMLLLLLSVPLSALAEESPSPQNEQPAQQAKQPPLQTAHIATVNDISISREDFDREMDAVQTRLSAGGQKPDEAQFSMIRGNVLESLIDRELLYQESLKNGANISEALLQEELANWKKQFPDETAFKDMMDKMNISEEVVKDQLKQRMMVQEFIDKEIGPKVKISDKKTKDFYDANPDIFKEKEQVKASHILIKAAPDAEASKKAEARKKIEDIQQKLKKGGDFAALAKEFSDGPSKTRGGDLGFFGRGQMVNSFEEAAFSLKTGSISDIVETRFGYHLIKVFDKKSEKIIAYEEAKGDLEEYLRKQKMMKEVRLYSEELKAKAKIERFL